MKQFLSFGTVVALFVICTGCGETFRPIIIPNPPQFPSPAAAHTVLAVSNNGFVANGTAMAIDVSGDTDSGWQSVGLRPVHAVQQSATTVIVANQSVNGANNDSLGKITFSGTTIANVTTTTLPANSAPNFVATTESNQVYASLPNYFLDPVGHPTDATVAVVNTPSNSIVANLMVGNNPVAIGETPDGTKLYVANQGDGTVNAFNTIDRSARQIDGTFTAPIWISARNDNERVYVLNGNGVLSTLDTHLTGGPDTVIDASITVPGATYMWYDTILNRLYIPGTVTVNGTPQSGLAILDVSQSVPNTLALIAAPAFAPLNLAPVPATATAVTSLPDGSRAYLASYAVLPTQLTISSVTGDGTNGTYTYSLTSGEDLTPGVSITITGLFNGGTELTDFEGTLLVSNVLSGTTACPTTCFQISNANVLAATAVSGSAAGQNVFPQVSVINAKNFTVGASAIAIPGFPDATNPANTLYYVPACATTRDTAGPTGNGFRWNMAAGGDSSRAYLATCDGGNVNIIYTSTDTYQLNIQAPYSQRNPVPPNQLNPPQNPVFMIAGP